MSLEVRPVMIILMEWSTHWIATAVARYHVIEMEKKRVSESKLEANVPNKKEDEESKGIRERDQ